MVKSTNEDASKIQQYEILMDLDEVGIALLVIFESRQTEPAESLLTQRALHFMAPTFVLDWPVTSRTRLHPLT